MDSYLFFMILFIITFSVLISFTESIQCFQCAAVDGRRCPENARIVDSPLHDSCITWKLGNGTVILQNMVNYQDECVANKVEFWTRFINLYYQRPNGEAKCCQRDNCNTGGINEAIFVDQQSNIGATFNTGENIPGAPLIFGSFSPPPPSLNQANLLQPTLPPQLAQVSNINNNIPNPLSVLNNNNMANQLNNLNNLPNPLSALNNNNNQLNGFSNNLPNPLSALNNNMANPLNGLNNNNNFNSLGSQLLLQQNLSLINNLVNSLRNTQSNIGGFSQPQSMNAQIQALLFRQAQNAAIQQQQQQQQQQSIPFANNANANINALPQISEPIPEQDGNCMNYFNKRGNGEWLPNTLIPLSFDRASESKIGVFYTRFSSNNGNNDHIIIRLVDDSKSNSTMYTYKIYRVGSVSLFVSKLAADRFGIIKEQEIRKASINDIPKISNGNRFVGFWITIKGIQLSLGIVGQELIYPIMVWNDTQREGPMDVSYFALTTDQSRASFGINCDVPNLHFKDTCVTDSDCDSFPNTVCSPVPINKGLDPGTRLIPFEEWKPRFSLLKSCFCREGHLRIPRSRGCYDPIRQVVTLQDACFANYHCKDLPNTYCGEDSTIPKYNMSCQCIPGNKPFESDPRTGLIEGCAPLTDEDKSTVLGCSKKLSVVNNFEWRPETLYPLKSESGVDYTVVYIKLGQEEAKVINDVAIIRLLDNHKDSRKMYTIKFSSSPRKISISESTRSRSFFFENERDTEKIAFEDPELMSRMQFEYVGFWIQYRYEIGLGGTLSVGLNGSPFSSNFAIVKWTDISENAIKRLRYIGFTGEKMSMVHYGVDCFLVDSNGEAKSQLFNQLPATQSIVTDTSGFGNSQANSFDQLSTIPNINRIQNFQGLPNSFGLQLQSRSSELVPEIEPSESTSALMDEDLSLDLHEEDPSIYLSKIQRLLPTLLENDQQDPMSSYVESEEISVQDYEDDLSNININDEYYSS